MEQPILASITRARLLEECDVTEKLCTADELAQADEAFAASTVREVMPITAIGEQRLEPGPVTEDARTRLMARIERELGLGLSQSAT
jgi:branched-subunit amino acid aminotransferase/4-amino-4-deoxychorismate lyase